MKKRVPVGELTVTLNDCTDQMSVDYFVVTLRPNEIETCPSDGFVQRLKEGLQPCFQGHLGEHLSGDDGGNGELLTVWIS